MIFQKFKWFLIIIILQMCFFHSKDQNYVINLKDEKNNSNEKRQETWNELIFF
jgi:hypothetical protein